jgi:hypothetical protein
MTMFAGLDVVGKRTAMCVVDEAGKSNLMYGMYKIRGFPGQADAGVWNRGEQLVIAKRGLSPNAVFSVRRFRVENFSNEPASYASNNGASGQGR